jgi:hypothetical protein
MPGGHIYGQLQVLGLKWLRLNYMPFTIWSLPPEFRRGGEPAVRPKKRKVGDRFGGGDALAELQALDGSRPATDIVGVATFEFESAEELVFRQMHGITGPAVGPKFIDAAPLHASGEDTRRSV